MVYVVCVSLYLSWLRRLTYFNHHMTSAHTLRIDYFCLIKKDFGFTEMYVQILKLKNQDNSTQYVLISF